MAVEILLRLGLPIAFRQGGCEPEPSVPAHRLFSVGLVECNSQLGGRTVNQ
jgi:hypothetical protein